MLPPPPYHEPARKSQQHNTEQNKRVNPNAMQLHSHTTAHQKYGTIRPGWRAFLVLSPVAANLTNKCLRKEGGLTYFWEESPRILRTEVAPHPKPAGDLADAGTAQFPDFRSVYGGPLPAGPTSCRSAEHGPGQPEAKPQ